MKVYNEGEGERKDKGKRCEGEAESVTAGSVRTRRSGELGVKG